MQCRRRFHISEKEAVPRGPSKARPCDDGVILLVFVRLRENGWPLPWRTECTGIVYGVIVVGQTCAYCYIPFTSTGRGVCDCVYEKIKMKCLEGENWWPISTIESGTHTGLTTRRHHCNNFSNANVGNETVLGIKLLCSKFMLYIVIIR